MTFWTTLLKWLPYILQIIGMFAVPLGVHNNAAMAAGNPNVPTLAAAPMAFGGFVALLLSLFGHIRNHVAAQKEIPQGLPISVDTSAKTELSLLGNAAQFYAMTKNPEKLKKIAELLPVPVSGSTGGGP